MAAAHADMDHSPSVQAYVEKEGLTEERCFQYLAGVAKVLGKGGADSKARARVFQNVDYWLDCLSYLRGVDLDEVASNSEAHVDSPDGCFDRWDRAFAGLPHVQRF